MFLAVISVLLWCLKNTGSFVLCLQSLEPRALFVQVENYSLGSPPRKR